MGYLTYGTDAANMLSHVVNAGTGRSTPWCSRRTRRWRPGGQVLHDEELAQAIVDQILERGRLLILDGPSLRTKHLGLDDSTSPGASDQSARISGIQRPEFPEPHNPGACQKHVRARRYRKMQTASTSEGESERSQDAFRKVTALVTKMYDIFRELEPAIALDP